MSKFPLDPGRMICHNITGSSLSEQEERKDNMSLKLMSYNIAHCQNFLTHEVDYDAVADVIRRSGADIIGLNEVYDDAEKRKYSRQPLELAQRLGFQVFFAPALVLFGMPYGNALLSRFPILRTSVIPVPDPETPAYDGYYETRCVLRAELDVPGGLCVCVTHFGLNPDEHANSVRTLGEVIRDQRFILMGDMNVTPDNPVLAPIRERLYDTAELFGKPLMSWPSDKPDRKIDYIFTSHDLKTLSADIPAELASDHRPYVAEIA